MQSLAGDERLLTIANDGAGVQTSVGRLPRDKPVAVPRDISDDLDRNARFYAPLPP
jgi:hypothetical protein